MLKMKLFFKIRSNLLNLRFLLLFTLIFNINVSTVSNAYAIGTSDILDDIWDVIWGDGEKNDQLDLKLLFNQLFALEIKKELDIPPVNDTNAVSRFNQHYLRLVRRNILYTPTAFDQAEKEIMGKATTSHMAYLLRKKIWGDDRAYQQIMQFDLSKSMPKSIRNKPLMQRYLTKILDNQNRKINKDENFFTSPEGENFKWAITYSPGGGQEDGQGDNVGTGVALVVVPGYAAHNIKFYIFEEIIHDINSYYGRPIERPLIDDQGLIFTPEDSRIYYGSERSGQMGHHKTFDILYPV
ncbi:MAG: hypothetical protein HQK53_10735, partial [Oligoflexia bacterium]|nr:hypothetical protein [Oligoflexia bacterium]